MIRSPSIKTILILGLFLFPFFAFATIPLPNALKCSGIVNCLELLADAMISIFTPIAVLVSLYAAFLFLTAGGRQEQIIKARNAMLWIVVGLAVVVLSKGAAFILQSIL